MLYEHRRPDVAVFIDFENVYVSVRDKLNANPNFETIMERCNDLGRVVISRAYADWYRYPRITSALYANSIEPMYVPTYYYDKEMGRTGRAIKNSVDMNLCIDTMKTLYTNTNIEKFVLVTGDRDFIPLVNSIRQQGKEVIVIGIGGAASTHLAQSADEFIFYEQLIGKPEPRHTQYASQSNHEQPAQSTPTQTPTENVYDTLVRAVHLVRERGYVSTLGSLKLVMKELMGGDFKENRYKDLNGRTFTKFKEFVMDAERRGKVQIFTSGTVNEVFLPGEDPLKLSQFAGDLNETTTEESYDSTVSNNGHQPPGEAESAASAASSASSSRSRRRRRPRGQRGTRKDTPEETQEQLADTESETPVQAADQATSDEETATAEAASADQFAPAAEPATATETPDEPSADMTDAADDLIASIDDDDAAETDEAPAQSESLLADMMAETHKSHYDDALFESVWARVSSEEQPTEDRFDQALADHQPTDEAAEPATAGAAAHTEAKERPTNLSLFAEEEETTAAAEPAAAEPAAAEAPDPPEDLVTDRGDELGEAAAQPTAEAVSMTAEETGEHVESVETGEAEEAEEAGPSIAFEDEEWHTFRGMMATFTKPVSFSQILDSLKELRNQQQLTRTNDQLRTMVKQAISNGLLERSGRGKRVYYQLASDDSD